MKIKPHDYIYQVCRHCRSKNLKGVAMVRMTNNAFKDLPGIRLWRTGYLCNNCGRYNKHSRSVVDRAEMRRDIARLEEFLYSGENS